MGYIYVRTILQSAILSEGVDTNLTVCHERVSACNEACN